MRESNTRRPDFFIIGAPKCGTTALAQYLREHPSICFSDNKEPYYFCSDFPGIQNCFSDREYLKKEFSHASPQHKAVGEGSVWYLYSQAAVPEILRFNPHARFIVMLRNPVDMLQSLHAQFLYSREEDTDDFTTAWYLQEERSKGRCIPRLCRQAEFLQYRKVASYGEQLERLFVQVPRASVHVILFEDFVTNPELVYRETLQFLGAEYDGRTNFPKVNTRKTYRFRTLTRLSHRPPRAAIALASALKRLRGGRPLGVSRLLVRAGETLNVRAYQTPPLEPQAAATIAHALSDDILTLEDLLKRDLTHWRDPAQ